MQKVFLSITHWCCMSAEIVLWQRADGNSNTVNFFFTSKSWLVCVFTTKQLPFPVKYQNNDGNGCQPFCCMSPDNYRLLYLSVVMEHTLLQNNCEKFAMLRN